MLANATYSDHPLHLPDHNAVLCGIVSGIQDKPRVAYYIHWRGTILIGELHGEDELTPELTTERESRLMGEQTAALVEDIGSGSDIEVDLSPIGEALYDAHRLGQHDILGVKQAHVYSLKEVHEFSRGQTATILNISPNTVDRHRRDANENVDDASAFVELLNQLNT